MKRIIRAGLYTMFLMFSLAITLVSEYKWLESVGALIVAMSMFSLGFKIDDLLTTKKDTHAA